LTGTKPPNHELLSPFSEDFNPSQFSVTDNQITISIDKADSTQILSEDHPPNQHFSGEQEFPIEDDSGVIEHLQEILSSGKESRRSKETAHLGLGGSMSRPSKNSHQLITDPDSPASKVLSAIGEDMSLPSQIEKSVAENNDSVVFLKE